MIKTITPYAVVALISFAAATFVTRTYYPNIKTVEVEKIVEKEVVKRDVVTVTKYLKDGKVVKETTKKDNSTIKKDKESDTTKIAEVRAAVSQWHIGVSSATLNMSNGPYALNVQRRLFGNIFLGGQVDTDNKYMIS